MAIPKHIFFNILLIFFLQFGNFFIFAQTNHTENLQTWILQTFPEAKSNSDILYIIDGVPISREDLENELTNYSLKELSVISYLDTKQVINSNLFHMPPDGVVLIITTRKKRRKWLKDNYQKAIGLFDRKSEVKESYPALIINGEQITPEQSLELFTELKLSQIKNITIIAQPVSIDSYGENGANGLVMIVRK